MVATYDAGFGHGDELYLLKLNDGRVIGYSTEFDTCTVDIEDTCMPQNCLRATWFARDETWEWAPATFQEIKELNLEKYLIGSKTDMKMTTPMDPI